MFKWLVFPETSNKKKINFEMMESLDITAGHAAQAVSATWLANQEGGALL